MQSVNGIGTTLYGHAKRGYAMGHEAAELEARGFETSSYQAVKWAVLFFLPVIPLGTYRVIPAIGSSSHSGRYLLQKTDWDWRQIGTHYLVGWSPCWGLAVIALLSALSGR